MPNPVTSKETDIPPPSDVSRLERSLRRYSPLSKRNRHNQPPRCAPGRRGRPARQPLRTEYQASRLSPRLPTPPPPVPPPHPAPNAQPEPPAEWWSPRISYSRCRATAQ